MRKTSSRTRIRKRTVLVRPPRLKGRNHKYHLRTRKKRKKNN